MAYSSQFSGARFMVVTSSGLWDKISSRSADFDNVKTVVFGPSAPSGTPPPGSKIQIVLWSELLAKGSTASHVPTVLDVRPQDAASWVFTAGLTGTPKAVVLTHQNMVEAAKAAQARFKLTPDDVIAAHLSPANAQQQLFDIVLPCFSGAHVSYCNPGTDFRSMCVAVSPTMIAGYPSQWQSLGQYFTSESSGKEISQLTEGEKTRLLASSRLDKCKWPLCVWSAISSTSCNEFRSIGIPLYRVYGLAEACGLVALEGPRNKTDIHLAVGTPIEVFLFLL